MSYLEERNKRKLGIAPALSFKKEPKPLKKVSEKRKMEMSVEKGDSALDVFFNEMRKRCIGKCYFCNMPTTYKHQELWRIAISHLLPKAKFKSIATNEHNWIELCWDCHTEFDNGKITWELLYDSHEWKFLRDKLTIVLPFVHPDERKIKLYSKLEKLVAPVKTT